MDNSANSAYIINKGTQNFFYGTIHNINYYGKTKKGKDEDDFVQPMTELQATAKDWREILPRELATEEAKSMIETAIEAGLIKVQGSRLRWMKSKQLLAYYAEQMCKRLNLTKGEKMTWKPFETLFNEEGLKTAKQDAMRFNYRFEPNGYEDLDALFE